MKKYRDWDLLEQLPENWKIDKTVGSPLFEYEFCTNGKSVLNGQKRALVKVTKTKIMKYKILQVDIFKPAGTIKQNCIKTLQPNIEVSDVEIYKKQIKSRNPDCDVYLSAIQIM